jgi:hypothetical protein
LPAGHQDVVVATLRRLVDEGVLILGSTVTSPLPPTNRLTLPVPPAGQRAWSTDPDDQRGEHDG